jgi:acyl phosphate:glycerol-3-phosphate acyltransferase
MVTQENILQVLIITLVSYLLGSIPTAYLIVKAHKNINIFEEGSGNMGGTNTARVMGMGWGLITVSLDALKGILAVIFSRFVMPDYPWTATTVASIMVVSGHNWSLFATLLYNAANKSKTSSSTLVMRGGKGAATAFGTLLMIAQPQVIIAMVTFGVVLFLRTRYASLGVLAAFTLALPWLVILVAQDALPPIYAVYAIIIALLIAVRFRENIQRLLTGTERRLGDTPTV